jgi:PAS domain S-box-containing protein
VSELADPQPPSLPDVFYRRLFDQAGMAMVAADTEGRIVGWNHSAVRMFGAGAEEMLGSPWWRIVPVENREEAKAANQAGVNRGATTEFSFIARDEHGASRKLAAIVTPISGSAGERIGALALVRDISNRMVLEQRLAQQSKMVALGEMAGAISHHFNNILGGVVTSVDFALSSRDPGLMQRVMEKTAQALTRASGLVESLLAFAQGDYRDANLGDLGEVVIELVRQIEDSPSRPNIRLEVDLQAMPAVEVPRTAMLTVLRNLTDNAAEAMPDGGVLRIAADCTDGWARVRITDTGCGLDEESLTRIFEPFYSTKVRAGAGGTPSRGLGLAVAHGVLKVLQGNIHVQSTLDEGTQFEIRIPVKPARPSENAAEADAP